jgi:hypothetical protein
MTLSIQLCVSWLHIFFAVLKLIYVSVYISIIRTEWAGVAQSVVSGYGLDDRAIEVRSLVEAEDFFSSLCVQTGSGAHPASCTMGTGVLYPGLKRGWGVTLTTHPHLVLRSRMSRSYTSSPPKRLCSM